MVLDTKYEEKLQKIREVIFGILQDEVPHKIEDWKIWHGFSVEAAGHLVCIEITLTYSYEHYNVTSSSHVRFMIEPDSPLIVSQVREYVCSMLRQATHYLIDWRRSVLETQRIVLPK